MSILERAQNLQSPRVRDLFVSVITDCMREMGAPHKKRPGIDAVCDTEEIAKMIKREIDAA